MAESVTSGSELNSYQGNAALAEGAYNTGYSKIDFSPLERYALKKFEVNKLDYEQQQKDRAKLEEEFNNPKLNVFLDKGLADQLKPMLDRQKQLSKMNLEKNPNSKEWYEFHDNYKELLKANAKAKLVQTEKEKYRKLSGETANPIEKKRMLEYADKLDQYKIGDEVPVYTKTFAYNDAFVPKGLVSKYTEERKSPDGKSVQKVEKTMYNPLGISKEYDRIEMTNPEAASVWSELANVAIETEGIDDINEARQKTYSQAAELNKQQFDARLKGSFDKYKKANPAKTYDDFLTETGFGVERDNIVKDFDFLEKPIFFMPLKQGERELQGFTYSTDPTTGLRGRLNVDDKTLAKIHGATANAPGEKEKIVGSALSITPEDEFKVGAQKAMNDADNAQQDRANRRSTGATNYGNELDLIAKGFKKDGKGGWIYPVAGAGAAVQEGQDIPYWDNYLADQLAALKPSEIVTKKGGLFSKDVKDTMPEDYTGDIPIPKDKIPTGLDVALFDVVDKNGKKKAINSSSKVKIRYKDGQVSAIVIDDVPYDKKDIDSKATRMNNKSMSGKSDAPVFETGKPKAVSSATPKQEDLRTKYNY